MIFLIAYLTGYAIYYPIAFKYLLSEDSCKPYDTGDVVFSFIMGAIFSLFYPVIIAGTAINNLFVQPFIQYLNRSE